MAKIIDITKKNSHHTEKFSPAAEIVALAGTYEAEVDILHYYAETVEELLPQMAELIGINVSDFILETGSLIGLDMGMKQGELSPLVYHAAKGDVEYSVSIGLEEEEEEGFCFYIKAGKFQDNIRWYYDFDKKCWTILDDLIISPKLEKMLDSDSPEAHILEEVMCAMDGAVTDKGYQSLKSKNKKLFDLYNRVSHFMIPYFNVEGEGKLYLEPRDDNRLGFRVGCTGSEYILYQYLDPFDQIDTDDMYFSEYFREVARTPDLKKMKQCLWMLANRYTEDVVYTIPLSLETYTESAGLKHIGRRSYCAWGRKDDFTAAEKKALESVKNYVKKF